MVEQNQKNVIIKLLIIDDDDIRELICCLINTNFGTSIENFTAADGLEGETQYNELMPDIVITDILMPHMDGFELIRKVRKINPHTIIIAITSGYEKKLRTNCRKALYLKMAGPLGADIVIDKTDVIEKLPNILYKLLSARP
jgi:YesN/AraC family two-component response regulator